jgi:benzoyl-CoA reductase/2-hydroxyglutaryl-CoA dehydratase subunit BcrC/BadD/HgdB
MGEAFNVWVRFAGYKDKSYLITYPHIIHTKHASDIMVKSFVLFKEWVENFTGKSIKDDEIESAIKVYNTTRRLLKQLWELLRAKNPVISGSDVATISLAAQVMDKQEFNGMLEELLQELKTAKGRDAGIRLLMTGGACDDLRMFDLLEDLNYDTNLVFVDSCTAARYFWFEVPEDTDDKLLAIAEGHISKLPCPSKDTVPGSGEKKRFRLLQSIIEDYKPDGVVMLYQRFCSPQSMDIMALKPVLKNLGIPWAELELDTTVPKVQFGTHLESLVETINRVKP